MSKKQKLAALTLCGLSLALLPIVFADAPEVALKPFLWFDVASRLPEGLRERSLAVKRIVARPGQLYFRILVGPSAAGEDNPGGFVIRTDGQGNFQSMIEMPQGTLDLMDVDDSGRLFLLKAVEHDHRLHQAQIMIYSPEGELISMNALPVLPQEFSVIGGSVAGVSPDGFVFRVSATPQPFPPDKHPVKTFAKGEVGFWVPRIASLPAGRFVVAEGLEGLVHLGSLSGGVERFFRPNVQHVNEKYHEYLQDYEQSKVLNAGRRGAAPRAILYPDLASDEIGDIFIGVEGYLPRDGAIVVQFDKDGTYKRTLRCSLPTFPDLPNDAFQGHMLLHRIAVSSGLLYVLDNRGMVAVYKLDD